MGHVCLRRLSRSSTRVSKSYTCLMRSLAIDRPSVVDWYLRNRARTRAIFDLIDPSAYYSRPIALRNPIVFYEGHLPAFSIISFLRRGLGRPPVDARLEKLFERGIDPDSTECRRAAQRRRYRLAVPRRSARLCRSRGCRHRVGAGGSGVSRRSSGDAASARRCTPRSSTKRCIRRRCSTCGIGCRMSRKTNQIR